MHRLVLDKVVFTVIMASRAHRSSQPFWRCSRPRLLVMAVALLFVYAAAMLMMLRTRASMNAWAMPAQRRNATQRPGRRVGLIDLATGTARVARRLLVGADGGGAWEPEPEPRPQQLGADRHQQLPPEESAIARPREYSLAVVMPFVDAQQTRLLASAILWSQPDRRPCTASHARRSSYKPHVKRLGRTSNGYRFKLLVQVTRLKAAAAPLAGPRPPPPPRGRARTPPAARLRLVGRGLPRVACGARKLYHERALSAVHHALKKHRG